MKRLGVLAVLVLAMGLGLVAALERNAPETTEAAIEPPPVHRIEAELTAEGLQPYRVRVPKNHEVRLLLHGGTDAPEGLLILSGYHDRLSPIAVGPGQSREIVFLADRPGDDFGFLMGERVLGRLEVTGGHLEEGHQ